MKTMAMMRTKGRNTMPICCTARSCSTAPRTVSRNRDVIVFDFEPNRIQPKTNFEKFAQRLKLIGAFWIDPIDKQVAAGTPASDTFKIAGGMSFHSAGFGDGLRAGARQHEVWMPSYQEVNFARGVSESRASPGIR